MKPSRYIHILPSIVTMLNGLCGFLAIIYASYEPSLRWSFSKLATGGLSYFSISAIFIIFGMIADVADGRIARAGGFSSNFGAQLDSLCDAVTFGAAPALLAYRMFCVGSGTTAGGFRPDNLASRLVLFAAVIFFVCALARLARFNADSDLDESSHMMFAGLPSPAAAGLIVGLVVFHENFIPSVLIKLPVNIASANLIKSISFYAIPFALFFTGLLMVSTIPYPHLINKLLRSKRPLISLIFIFIVFLFAIVNFNFTFLLGFFAFILYGMVIWIGELLRKKGQPKDNKSETKNNNDNL